MEVCDPIAFVRAAPVVFFLCQWHDYVIFQLIGLLADYRVFGLSLSRRV
jgi:hypothetical protein